MNKEFISEEIKTPIIDEYDIFVLGGGIAGIASALSAARQNKRVLLCENSFILGGLATSGLVTIYLPLCDGLGKQVCFGIAEELLKLSVKDWHSDTRGYNEWVLNNGPHSDKSQRYAVDFNPQLFALAAEELLLKENVEILYGTKAVSCVKKDNKITHVIIDNNSGRQAIKAKCFIDASGDADLAYFSNTPTVNFKQGNILAAWYYFLKNGISTLNPLGFCDIPDAEKKKTGESVKLLSNKRFLGLDGKELSDMTIMSHNTMYLDMLKRLQKDNNAIPVTMPTIPQIRMTRRIDGEYTIKQDDVFKYFENSIGLVPDWRKRGPVYEVPFETLYNKETVNLLCVGRCVSNDEYMWDIMRVIPCCALTGEAAGVAASMNDDMSKINIKDLQNILIKNGVKIHNN